MYIHINSLHITLIVINEMPIFVAKCDHNMYFKMESLLEKIFAIQQMPCILIQFPTYNVTLPYNSYIHTVVSQNLEK